MTAVLLCPVWIRLTPIPTARLMTHGFLQPSLSTTNLTRLPPLQISTPTTAWGCVHLSLVAIYPSGKPPILYRSRFSALPLIFSNITTVKTPKVPTKPLPSAPLTCTRHGILLITQIIRAVLITVPMREKMITKILKLQNVWERIGFVVERPWLLVPEEVVLPVE